MTEWQSQKVERDGVRLNYVRTGDGDQPLLILCHGLTDNGLCWQRTADALAADFDVVMLDARNHGLSGDGPASVHDMAADISHLVTSLGSERAMVMGHSVGAATAAAFAGDFPEQTTKVILEDPPWREKETKPSQENAAKQHAGFAKYIESLQSKSEEDIAAFGKHEHPNWHDDDFPAWAASKKLVKAHATEMLDLDNWRELVPKITSPALLIYGDQDNGCDGITTASVADEIAAMNSSIKPHHVAGAGHNLRREQFAPFIQAVRDFLLRD